MMTGAIVTTRELNFPSPTATLINYWKYQRKSEMIFAGHAIPGSEPH